MKNFRILNSKAFTLIELIVVIAVISALSAIAIPKFSGIIEKARLSSDKASVRVLNNTTTIYKISENISREDVFSGLSSDEDRISLLVNSNYLSEAPSPRQPGASFNWHVEDQIWQMQVGDELVPLSPLGSDFEEISSGMIAVILERYTSEGSYGRTWGDYRYTDLGLDPDDWQDPINHMIYKPSGKRLLITPEEGYEFHLLDTTGETKTVWNGYNLIYDAESENWYWHSISDANIVDIDTLRVEN